MDKVQNRKHHDDILHLVDFNLLPANSLAFLVHFFHSHDQSRKEDKLTQNCCFLKTLSQGKT